ncbi:phage tail protein [Sorangium sp. So ce341]|uniref:phage tail protein n=1 Tax=Sorangium sp. So ce341 TaxID=3133302 RepID=UPI003F62F340
MTRPSERLRALLPSHYAARDARLAGAPLAALLDVLGSELDRLDQAIDALYDDHFVERASPGALPLLAELLGAELFSADPAAVRAVLARTIAWRRRKGTLAALEEMLSIASRHDVEVEEGFRSLLFAQDVGHVLPERGRTALVTDPVVMADALSRRPPARSRRDGASPHGHRSPAPDPLAPVASEPVEHALRRLGRADAGRYAASPRFVDLTGWARPEGLLVRAAKLVAVTLRREVPAPVSPDSTELGAVRARPGDGRRFFHVDPADVPVRLAWPRAHEPAAWIPTLTAQHEPGPAPAPARTGEALLTPTGLADAAAAVEASGAFAIEIEGARLVGPDPVMRPDAPRFAARVGPRPLLRFADLDRPCAGDAFTLELLAIRPEGTDVLLAAPATAGAAPTPTAGPLAHQGVAGAQLAVRVTRTAGTGARRTSATGTWTPISLGPQLGPACSNAATLTIAGATRVARLERVPGTTDTRLALLDPDVPGAWTPLDLAGALPPAAAGITLLAHAGALYALAPDPAAGAAPALAVFEIAFAGDGTATSARRDDPGARRPRARSAPAACAVGDTLYLHGGAAGQVRFADLWSFSLTTGTFTAHAVRHAAPRALATLLPAFGGLVLVGGEPERGQLATAVLRCDPNEARPTWRPLAPLPAEAGRPGQVIARAAGAGLDVLLWADRTRPRRCTLASASSRWDVGEPEPSPAPNPPAWGDATHVDDDVLVVRPAPLPPSEVLAAQDGAAVLAFLPAVDLAVAESATFTLAESGAATLALAPGETAPVFVPSPYGRVDARRAPPSRLGVTGRLAFAPYLLRQRSLGAWQDPALAPDADDVVGLDPRLGRVLLPAGAPAGRITVAYRRGAGALLGAGFAPPGRVPHPAWDLPDDPAPQPPDLVDPPAPVTAWVWPERAGLAVPGSDAPVVASVEAAFAASSAAAHPVVTLLGAARLPPSRVGPVKRGGLSLVTDAGSSPMLATDPEAPELPSLRVIGGADTRRDTSVFLAGLWLAGRLDLEMARGRVDIRYATLGTPGDVALRVAGASHQDVLLRRSLHETELVVRLVGCVVGAVEVPPWVRLLAVGCTFDAGSPEQPAISAAGAVVHLRHVTVRGAISAGALHASSSVLAGPVSVDRTDLGFIRCSLLRRRAAHLADERLPRRYHSIERPVHAAAAHGVSFASVEPGDPTYLVLADNNGPAALAIGEMGRVPGAHTERGDRDRELYGRAASHVPIRLVAHHTDRVVADLHRMRRTSP